MIAEGIKRAAKFLDTTHPSWWREVRLPELHKEIRPVYVYSELYTEAMVEELTEAWEEEIAEREFLAWKNGKMDYVDMGEKGRYKVTTEPWG